jgi:prophage antirepressor-like protein
MENQLQLFAYDENAIRTVSIDNEPWFVAKDVATALGYAWKGATGTMPHVPEEWKMVTSVQTTFGEKETTIISEQGLYFFLARSDKPLAIPFQKWIAGEVLPTIRKTGKYETEQSHHVDFAISNAKKILDAIKEYYTGDIPLDIIMQFLNPTLAIPPQSASIETQRLYTTAELGFQTRYSDRPHIISEILVDHGILLRIPRKNNNGHYYKPVQKYVDGGFVIAEIDSDEEHPQILWTVKGRNLVLDTII